MLKEEKIYRYKRIANDIRSDVMQFHSPGDFLETEQALGQKFAANHLTIRRALDELVGEGLISRSRGRGTVVTDRLLTGEFAVVIHPHLLGPDASPVFQKIAAALMQYLHEENRRYKIKVHFDSMVESSQGSSVELDLLEPKVMANIRGIFAFHALPEAACKLAEAGIPIVRVGPIKPGSAKWSCNYSIDWDWNLFLEQALSAIDQSGCRTVGFLDGHIEESPLPGKPTGQLFLQQARAAGLLSDPKWIANVQDDGTTERHAYDFFMRFWQQPDRPDGLVIMDDIICRGVLRAILQLGIEMPRQLRLVTQANFGVDLPFHRPVTRVEYDSNQFAAKAVSMMLTLTRGKKLANAHVTVPCRLIQGETT